MTDLTQAEEALRVAEEAVAVSRIAALERRAKPVRRASRAVRARGMDGGLRRVRLRDACILLCFLSRVSFSLGVGQHICNAIFSLAN